MFRDDARHWKSSTVKDARKQPNTSAVVRVLRRATRDFPKPMGTLMALERRSLFELLVSTVCSAQARDATTYPRMVALFRVARTPEAMAHIPLARLKKILYPISYYNTKARHLIELSKQIVEWRRVHRCDGMSSGGAPSPPVWPSRSRRRESRRRVEPTAWLYESRDGRDDVETARPSSPSPATTQATPCDIPHTMEELIALPGVGRKTANLVLTEGFGRTEGVCVDTHVHRISNRLGIVRTKSRTDTERALMQKLPRRLWAAWNPLLVMWGQNICTPISPKCSVCPLRAQCQRRGVVVSR